MRTHTPVLSHGRQRIIHKAALFSLVVFAVFILFIGPAMAGSTPMSTVICTVVNFFSGNLGRGLSTLGIIVVGVGAVLGKVTWGMAITVAIGISVMFNASALATSLGASSPC